MTNNIEQTNLLTKQFEDKEVKIILDDNGEPLFELYSIGMALGYVKKNGVGKEYPKKDRIEKVMKNAEISGCVQSGHTYLSESEVYDFMFEAHTEPCKAFKKWLSNDVLPQIRQTAKALESIKYEGNIGGLVFSKDGVPITTSRTISEITGKEHYHILRDIREEINKLSNIHNPNLDSDIIINDFKEITYIAENGQTYKEYELGEMATMQIMLKYSTEFRAMFILAFQKMKQEINNMFKARVVESVLPQDNRLRQYIYVIKNPLNETVKIGVANDVDKRLKQLQTGAGIELELIYKSVICSNAFSIERDVHKHFEEYRTFGEWFKINPTEVINFLEQQTFVLNSEFMKYLSIL